MKKILSLLLLCSFTSFAQINHFFVVSCFENQPIGNVTPQVAPYINKVASEGTLFTNLSSLGGPSQPNYFRNFCGKSVTTNNNDIGVKVRTDLNLYTQLKAKGFSWGNFIEGLPLTGSTVFTSGAYAGKHDAARSFSNVDQTVRKPFNLLPQDLNTCPTVTFLSPDMNSSGHDQNLQYADNWLKTNPNIQRVIAFCQNPLNKSVFVIMFDEGNTTSNKIFVSLTGFGVKKGIVNTSYNQYDVLNLFLDYYSTQRVGDAALRTVKLTGWQQDSIVTVPKDTTQTICFKFIIRDSTFSFLKDTLVKVLRDTTLKVITRIQITCDTTVTIDTSFNTRWMYISNADTKIGFTAKENMMIGYAKQLKFTGFYLYDLQTILQTTNGKSKLNAFILKAHASGIKVGGVGGSLTAFDRIKEFDLAYPANFDALIRENEVWGTIQGNNSQALTNDNAMAISQSNVALSLGINDCGDYIGHLKPPIAEAFAEELVRTSTSINIHYYRTGLDSNYAKIRPDLLYVEAKKQNKPIHIHPLMSFEPVFMGNWVKTNSLESITPYFKKFYKKYEPYLICEEFTAFSDDWLMLVIPYKAPNLFRQIFPVNYIKNVKPSIIE